MDAPHSADVRALEDKVFLSLVVAVSLAFVWVLRPFYGAVLWATIAAIMFVPLYRRLLRSLRQRPTVAALATVLIILVLVILPLTLLLALLLQEGFALYERIQSGEVDVGRYFQGVFDALPPWAVNLLDRVGLTSLRLVQERLSAGLAKSAEFLAGQALNVGQNTLNFIISLFLMLYLLFFLLRDGDHLLRRIRAAIPLPTRQQHTLFRRFAGVIRATVKGNLVVAVVQGLLGGLIFWVLGIHAPALWGALMTVLSLVPAIGAAVVWLPVAIYFLATGALWEGIVLAVFGVLVIGLVDNILRPALVGKDTKLPDYVVLISTLGGIAVFGLNGFVIGPAIAAMFMAVWGMVSTARSDQVAGSAPITPAPDS